MNRRVLVTTSSFGKLDASPIKCLEDSGFTVFTNPYGRRLTEEEAESLLAECNPVGVIAGVEPLTAKVLDAAKALRVISRCGAGLDTVDLCAARQRGVRVENTPSVTIEPVAELTLGLILSLLRGIHLSHASICGGSWHRPMGALLSGKTVGVVGYGKIGSHLAHLLKPFGCEIFAFDTSPLCHFPASVQQAAFSELLFESDIVTLHLPYNRKTHHLMNESSLRRMKKGAYFVNAARGGLVDEAALYQVLRSGKLAGAALDTFGEEPYCGPLSSLDNVLLTAHIGSYAFESRVRMETESVNNLVRVLAEGRRDCGKAEGA